MNSSELLIYVYLGPYKLKLYHTKNDLTQGRQILNFFNFLLTVFPVKKEKDIYIE